VIRHDSKVATHALVEDVVHELQEEVDLLED
jgi:hypothetical protein